jgi:hypothetical protein
MGEEDLELLVTIDDPGEEDLQEDTFDHSQTHGVEPGASIVEAPYIEN